MNNTVKDSAIKKLKLLITVVDRPRASFTWMYWGSTM